MTSGSVQSVLTSELCVVPLPNDYLHLNDVIERESAKPPKYISVNFMVLPLSTLYELHQGVANELKV